ncbi:MAG: hypothetical protein ACYTG4_15510 [Planctomycetota bacterium]|jgi:hypothetical protein
MKRAVLVAASALLLLPPASANAQDARITNDVDTTLVTVGDRIRMTVVVEHAAGARVVWPDSLNLSPFEVLGAEALPPSTEGGRVRTGAVFTLAAFELGELEIPSFDVRVEGPGDESQELATDRFGIEVASVGADEGGDIRGIRGPLGIPVSVVTVSVWLLVLLAAVVVAVWLLRRWRRDDDGAPEAPGPPPRPPHEVALEALDRIESSSMLELGQVKEYHIEVSEALRTYVEHRFHVPALEMTTREVVQGLHGVRVSQDFIDDFRRFLDQCDMVKFAKVRPDAERSASVLTLGRDLVTSSIPAVIPDEDDAESTLDDATPEEEEEETAAAVDPEREASS